MTNSEKINYQNRFDENRFKEPRRFLVRYSDSKKLYSRKSTFYNRNAAIRFIQSLKWIGSELEIFDTKNCELVVNKIEEL